MLGRLRGWRTSSDASGIGGAAPHAPLFGDARLAFDQSAIGKATLKATRYAVLKALQRFQRVGL
jgi:hypothetical protein